MTWLTVTATAQVTPLPTDGTVIETIAFGSCAKQNKPMPVWDIIAAREPELFLFIGDNMYADLKRHGPDFGTDDIGRAYVELAESDRFTRFRRSVPILATWDDHDYGINDAGRELPFKRASQHMLLQFFREPIDSPRWDRPGVYGSWTFGPEGKRVQIILLDTRYFRDKVDRRPGKRPPRRGPYVPTDDTSRSLLGEAQWQWLEGELRRPAEVRIIASSIQVVAWEHGWESWGNFPHERQRLFDLISETGAGGVVFVTGDRHLMEVSRIDDDDADAVPYAMWDFTSSGLNEPPQPVSEPNRFRVSGAIRDTNFGVLRIDWDADPVTITFEGRGREGVELMRHRVTLDALQPSGHRRRDAPPMNAQ